MGLFKKDNERNDTEDSEVVQDGHLETTKVMKLS